MKYSKFKLAYKFNFNDNCKIDDSCKGFYCIQKLFEVSYTTFFLADSFKLAIWYTKKLDEFKSLIEANDITEKDKQKSAFLVYSQLKNEYDSLSGKRKYNIAV